MEKDKILHKRAQAAGRMAGRALGEAAGRAVSRELQQAFEEVLPKIAALMGEGFERKAFREDLARYLLEQGVPPEAVSSIAHGYEVELAAKAMLFDRMARQRAEAYAKLEAAPELSAPRRAALPEGDRKRRARAALNKNPNSTEALAELFAAM